MSDYLHWNGGVLESKDAEDDSSKVREANAETELGLLNNRGEVWNDDTIGLKDGELAHASSLQPHCHYTEGEVDYRLHKEQVHGVDVSKPGVRLLVDQADTETGEAIDHVKEDHNGS